MERIFLTLLPVSAVCAAIIIPLWLLSPLLNRRYAARMKYLLWLVIAARLLIPFDLTFDRRLEVSLPDVAKSAYLTDASTSADDSSPTENSVPAVHASLPVDNPVPVEPVAPKRSTHVRLQEPEPVELLTLVWLSGAAAMLIWQAVVLALFRKKFVRGGRPCSTQTVALAARISNELGLRRIPKLTFCAAAPSPMALGLLDPAVVLNCEEPGDELEFILRHELTHIRRRDLWYKALMLAVLCIHWFNPAVWIMFRCAGRDAELCCDSEVAGGSDMSRRRAYSEALLSAIRRGQSVAPALSTSFYGGKRTLLDRFSNILDPGKRKKGAAILLPTLICVIIACGLVACAVPGGDPLAALPSEPAAHRIVMLEGAPDGAALSFDHASGVFACSKFDYTTTHPYNIVRAEFSGGSVLKASHPATVLNPHHVICAERYVCAIASFREDDKPVTPVRLCVCDMDKGETRFYETDIKHGEGIITRSTGDNFAAVVNCGRQELRIYDPATGGYTLATSAGDGERFSGLAVCGKRIYLLCQPKDAEKAPYIRTFSLSGRARGRYSVGRYDEIARALREGYSGGILEASDLAVAGDGDYISLWLGGRSLIFKRARRSYEPFGALPHGDFSPRPLVPYCYSDDSGVLWFAGALYGEGANAEKTLWLFDASSGALSQAELTFEQRGFISFYVNRRGELLVQNADRPDEGDGYGFVAESFIILP